MGSTTDSEDNVRFNFPYGTISISSGGASFRLPQLCLFQQTDAVLQIFENLQKNVDPKVLENKTRAAEERERQHYESAQRRFADLVSS